MAFDQCTELQAEAASFVLGDVPAEARAAMVTHLDSCGVCRREVAALAEALDSLSLATPPMAPSPGFVDRVLAAAGPITAPRWAEEEGLEPLSISTVDEGAPAPYLYRPAARPVAERPVAERPVAVVMRRRRTLLALTAATAGLSLMAVGFDAWPLMGLAIAAAVLEVAYLGLVIRITHTKARDEMVEALRAGQVVDDSYWRDLESEVVVLRSGSEPAAAPVVGVPNTALARFVVAYFLGWMLTPLVALIALVRGDLSGIDQSPFLARIVELQRRGRAQSLKLLVAGATTVAVAGGGTATMLVAPGIASAAPAATTYTVHAGDTLSAIAARYGVSTSYLAELNGISDPNVILPGEVIRLSGRPASAPAGGTSTSGGSYVVRMGDTLDAIAERCNTSPAELAVLNHLSNPNLILVGQVLRLPSGAAATPAASPGTSTGAGPRAGRYTVRTGDTLGAIAARFGTTVASLAAANHIADPNVIEVGQVLLLAPAAAPVGAPPTTAAPAPAVTTSAPISSGYVNPFRFGSWSASRIDEGVDWIPNVTSPVVAIGDGVITYSSTDSGWPAGGFITYRLTSGSHAGLYVYVAEHITNLLPAGTAVRAGQQIATALPGYPWTEWGWASPSGPEPAPSARYNGAPNGTATPGGRAFARFLISLGVTGIPEPGPGPTTP
ncbi:MAG TPA: LysM peptidoglycan-binding domain-containing protein [Acidimicrobiales bacterium]|nr:LysM peptidoglycan-binding domain-containing protein [Acidimicrobiales bacterium]